jgi:hypothetical protein
MQTRTRASRWLDRILGGAILYSLCFLWFAARLGRLIPALLLALTLTLLAFWSARLFRSRVTGRRTKREVRDRERQAALYALTMLPYGEALAYAVQALMDAYPLKSLFCLDGLHYLSDARERRIAVKLLQSPQPASLAEAHAFHRERGTALGALVCPGGASREAMEYAAALTPPLKLIPAGDLPLPAALLGSAPAKEAQKRRTAASVLAMVFRPAQALRYMMLGFALVVAYLLTDRLTCLIPALALVFLALISKGREEPRGELF